MSDDTDKLDEFHKQLRAVFAELIDENSDDLDVIAAVLTAGFCTELFTEMGVEGTIKWALKNPAEFQKKVEEFADGWEFIIALAYPASRPGEEITGD